MTEPSYAPHRVGWTPEKVGRFWDFEASNDAARGSYFSAHAGRAIVERVDSDHGLARRRVLDFGCGRGDLLAHLFDRGIAASGLEFSTESIAETQRRFEGQSLLGGLTAAETLPTGLADGSFDAVLLIEVLEHLLPDQLEPTLAEVARLLAPGGIVVATTPHDENLAGDEVCCPDCGAIFHRWQHQRSLTPSSIAALFAPHGFRTVTAEPVDWSSPRLLTLARRVRRPGRKLTKPHLLYVGAR